MDDNIPPSNLPPAPQQPGTPIDPALQELARQKILNLLKGNGVKADALKIEKFSGQTFEFLTFNSLTVKARLTKRRQPGKVTGPTVVSSAQDMQAIADKEALNIRHSTEAMRRVKDMILERADMGIGLRNELIKTPFFNKDFVHYEPCSPCQGRGRIICPRCTGKGSENCPRCHAAGVETCPVCSGRQYVQGPDGNNIQCLRCNGSGKQACTLCNQAKKVQCTSCKGRMHLTCQQCNGHAVVSVIGANEVTVEANYDYDRSELPPAAVRRIDVIGSKIRQHAEVVPVNPPQQQKDGAALMAYLVKLPLADITFSITRENAEPINFTALLFGKEALLLNTPPFLETLLAPGIKHLEAAAGRGPNVSAQLQKAARYKTLRLIILASSKLPAKKALAAVMAKTEVGLSPQELQRYILITNKALSRISFMPRMMGCLFGLILSLCLIYLYFYEARGIVSNMLPTPVMVNIVDILATGCALSLAYFGGVIMAANAKRNGLKSIQPQKKK